MDYLQALTPDGLIHSTTCAHPGDFGEQFTRTMQRQGYTVVRLSMDEYRALRGLSGARAHQAQKTAPEPERCVLPSPRLHLPYGGSRPLQLALLRLSATQRAWNAGKRGALRGGGSPEEHNLAGKPPLSGQTRLWHTGAELHAVSISARRQLLDHVLFGRPLIGHALALSGLHVQAKQAHAAAAALWERDQRDREARRRAEQETRSPTAAFPPAGTEVLLVDHGRTEPGTVVTLLRGFEGTGAIVVQTRRGQHLARPDGPVTWALPEAGLPSSPPSEPVQAPPVPPAPKPSAMPSLFGDWST